MSEVAAPAAVLVGPSSVVRLHVLSAAPQGDRVVLGRPATGRFVAVPQVGARAVELLAAGRSVAEVERELTPADADADDAVDVRGFVRSLVGLGFVAEVDGAAVGADGVAVTVDAGDAGVAGDAGAGDAVDAGGAAAGTGPTGSERRARRTPRRAHAGPPAPPRAWGRALVTWPAAVLAVAAAVASVVVVVAVPRVRPHALDVFFLDSPARSLAALTVATYLLAAAHELAHVQAAAALGVPARVRVTRRLYLLTFETNLTGLWALPPRRRVGPLLAGMGFDAVVLCVVLVLRVAQLGPDGLLAALAVVEVAALVTQLFVFLRTDVYAVMTALLGCTTLAQTTRLLLRRAVRRLTPEQRAVLASTPVRDLEVARWYRAVHVGGMVVAAWFFVVFFVPSTWHLVVWSWRSLAVAGPSTPAFWEALVLTVLLLSPRALTVGVAVRDVLARRAALRRA